MSASATDLAARHSLAGFYKSSFSKCLLSWLGVSHAALQVPSLAFLKRRLVALMPDVVNEGRYVQCLASKMAAIHTREALLLVFLVYQFRIFERRYGTRKFASNAITAFLLSALLEAVTSFALANYYDIVAPLSFGPVGLVSSWLVPYYCDVVQSKSTTVGGISFSSKFFVYAAITQLILADEANVIALSTGLIAGVAVRSNLLGLGSDWIPKSLASIVYKFFGQWIESGPPAQGLIGATIEVQRTQQMEALENQLMRQQQRQQRQWQQRQHPNMMGQGFRDRLVDPRFNNDAEPSAANVNILVDMGFSRERAENALRQTGDDLEAATAFLIQEVN